MLDAVFDAALRENEQTPNDKKDSPLTPDATIRRIIQLAAGLDRKLATRISKNMRRTKNLKAPTLPETINSRTRRGIVYEIAVDLVDKDPALAVSVAQRALVVSVPSETLTFWPSFDKRILNSVIVCSCRLLVVLRQEAARHQ